MASNPPISSRIFNHPNVPPAIDALICEYLLDDQKALASLMQTSKGAKQFIKNELPKHSRLTRERYLGRMWDDLTPLQKLELEFLKFNDRPVWQRVAIVGLCLICSPLILIYHSPKIAKQLYASIIRPLGQKILESTGKVFNRLVLPAARFTYQHLLLPLLETIEEIATAIFVAIPKALYKQVLKPIAIGSRNVAVWSYENIALPIGRVVSTVAKGVFIKFPLKIYTHILVPVGEQIGKGCNFAYSQILSPIGNGIHRFAMLFFKQVLVPLKLAIDLCAYTFHTVILIPSWNVICAFSDFVSNFSVYRGV